MTIVNFKNSLKEINTIKNFYNGNKEENGESQFKEIGNIIKKNRNIKNMTQEELSRRINITQAYLSRIERGERFPSLNLCSKIARELGIEEDEFLKKIYENRVRDITRYLYPESKASLSIEERTLIEHFKGMNKEAQDRLLELLAAMSEDANKRGKRNI